MAKKKLSDERMLEIIEKAVDRYKGDVTVLESAVGALVIGRLFGWHVLRLIHSGRTFAKYEGILEIKFREELPERGPEAHTIYGIKLADKIGKFWQAIAGGQLVGPDVRTKGPVT